jgi:RimJ/RimL family protein N-acetyltransferase/ketosteroid isomerase-like protein
VVAGDASAVERLAGRVKEALEAADLDALARLLDPGVRWGPPGDPVPPCRDREQVMTWYRRARDAGARARVTETVVCGDKIVAALKVTGGRAARPGEEADRWQGFTVADGRITAVTGFDDRDEAAIWAGLAPAPPAPPGAIRWAAPGHRLADDQVGLRLPELADAAVLHRYAARPGGLDGRWVPLPGNASLPDCRALVRDWLAGWGNQRSFHGPALIITAADDPALAGLVGLGDRGGRVVELAYGVAPDRRGRGHATRAARLAARWLLHDGPASLVELRIDPANTASQRVAAAAGFTRDPAIGSHVPAAGKPDDDLRFVMRHHPPR